MCLITGIGCLFEGFVTSNYAALFFLLVFGFGFGNSPAINALISAEVGPENQVVLDSHMKIFLSSLFFKTCSTLGSSSGLQLRNNDRRLGSWALLVLVSKSIHFYVVDFMICQIIFLVCSFFSYPKGSCLKTL